MISGRFRADSGDLGPVGRSIVFPAHGEREEERVGEAAVALSDPNINPAYLACLVFIGSNSKVFMPTKDAILQRYIRKFSKHGKLLDADLGLITPGDGQAGSSEAHAQLPAPT